MPRTAVIAGATGLVGGELLKLLQEDRDYSEVIVLSRRPISNVNEKVNQHIVNFDHLLLHKEKLRAHDFFCCLGTTMKRAGSKNNFYKIDFSYVLSLAQIAKENNARSFNLVSALGANKKSFFYYSKVKGQIEEAVAELHIKILNIIRPSLIIGERKEKRVMEGIAQKLSGAFSFLFNGPLKNYRPVEARLIALALQKAAKFNPAGINIIESQHIQSSASKVK